jgi:hypothetical protein
VNGSTAATHASGATVSAFEIEASVRRAVTRQTAFQYSRRGAYESKRVQDFATIEFPADTLAEFRSLLGYFANL